MSEKGVPWWHGDEIRVYHGTTSALLPSILEDGLVPFRAGCFRDSCATLAEEYLSRMDATAKQRAAAKTAVDRRILYRTQRVHGHGANDDALFFASSMNTATNYAHYAVGFGGEVAYEIWDAIRGVVGEEPPHRFTGDVPVVLTLTLPTDWCELTQLGPLPMVQAQIRAGRLSSEAASLLVAEVKTHRRIMPTMLTAIQEIGPDRWPMSGGVVDRIVATQHEKVCQPQPPRR